MTAIHVTGPHISPGGIGTRVAVDLRIGDERHEWWYETTSDDVSTLLDPFAAGVIVPAMKTGLPVLLHGPVSQSMIDQLPLVQRVYEIWRTDHPHHPLQVFRRVDVHPDEIAPARVGAKVASFFSGGVDSFHTALVHEDTIDDLIYVDDFEMRFPDDVREAVHDNALAAAAAMGKPLVRVRTNYRDIFLPYVTWRMTSGFLPSIAALHAPDYGVVFAASGHDLSSMSKRGIHVLLDGRYGAGGQQIIHDGFETIRLEKVDRLSESATAMRHLRVCWQPAVNCGTCSKCVRTRLALAALGRDDATTSFPPGRLTAEEVEASVRACTPGDRHYFEEIEYWLSGNGRHPELADAVRRGCVPVVEPIPRDHALAVLAPEGARRIVRWARGRRAAATTRGVDGR